MKKRLFSLFLVVCMVVTLAACGGNTTAGNESGLDPASSETDETPASSETISADASDASASSKASDAADKNDAPSGEKKTLTTYDNKTLPNAMTVISGNKKMTEGLDFGGQTFTMAVTAEEPQYHTGSFKRMIAAFQKKYNCKIEVKELVFNNYNQQVAQAMSGGKPYDICFQHGSMYPGAAIANLYEDLTTYFTTADFATGDNKSGIDVVKTSYYVWDNKITGVSNYKNQYPQVMYYNKLLFEANDLEDPLELYNEGKWTWNKIKSMGQKVTDATSGIYFLSEEFHYLRTMFVYGVPQVTVKDGKPVNNLSSKGCVNGLNLIRSLYVGSSAIARKPDNGSDKYQDFLRGNVFITAEESAKFPLLVEGAKTSVALGKSKDNIGIVPIPLDASNTEKSYPAGRLFATSAGKGSKDPRVAVAWSLFWAEYTDAVKDSTDMTAEQKALCDKLVMGNTCFSHGVYSTSSANTNDMSYEIPKKVIAGGDISQIVSTYSAQFDACISATLKK